MKNETIISEFSWLTPIKDALNNLLPDSGASDDYCQGVMLGLMSDLMANGMSFGVALNFLAKQAN